MANTVNIPLTTSTNRAFKLKSNQTGLIMTKLRKTGKAGYEIAKYCDAFGTQMGTY
jgi:hypothetical protein